MSVDRLGVQSNYPLTKVFRGEENDIKQNPKIFMQNLLRDKLINTNLETKTITTSVNFRFQNQLHY
jgi:hypothetical protein